MKNKYLLIFSVLFAIFLIVFAAKKIINYATKEFTVVQTFKNASKDEPIKADQPDMFTKYFKGITTPIGGSASGYKMNYKVEELTIAQKRFNQLKYAKASLQWVLRGPTNVGGRTRALIIDPDDATHNTWFVGAASGGIWKTVDAGVSWIHLSEQFTNLSVNAMAMAESNHDVIYAGTGESFPGGTNLFGNGLWKSLDRGINWVQINSTSTNENFGYINRVIIDPTNADIVLVATETGIFKSTDGGSSWDEVYISSYGVEDLVADPSDFNIQFAGDHNNGILRSTTAGNSWALSSDGIGSGTRFEVTVSPVDHNNVFASVNVSDTISNVYISEDNGISWKKFNSTQAFLNTQGDYDNIIEAHPYNANEVFVGGVDIWKLAFNGTTEVSDPAVKNAYTINTSFLSFINFGGAFLGGGMSIEDGTDRLESDWVSVEIRFGAGLSQKAHRFTVPNGATSGVPATDYAYVNYVDVPFQVWDVSTVPERQLMVSFRDQEKDGEFNIYERTGDAYGELDREYIFVNAVTYNASAPNVNIATNGGHLFKNLYMFWPVLASGATWTPGNLPVSKIVVDFGTYNLYNGEKTCIADANGEFGGPNTYNQSAGFGTQAIPGLHPDHHNFAIIPTDGGNFTFIDASDGGIGISTDNAATFKMLVTSYITTQFYGVTKNPEANEYFGGMQDNGSWQSPSGVDASNTSRYLYRIGGDGFECLWHAENPNLMLGSIYNNAIQKSTNKGATWTSSKSGIASDDGPFITRLSASREDPDLVFAVGNTGVYKSVNFGTNWIKRSITPNWAVNDIVSSSHNVEVSLANGNIVWAGGGMSTSFNLQLHVSTNEGSTFSGVPNYSIVDMNAYTSGIATHPIEDSTAYVLFSLKGKPKVLRTTNLGQTWEDISGFGTQSTSSNGFPDVVVHCLLVMPHDPNTLWVGTDIGLFESNDNGTSWHIANNGLPPVSVYDMQIVGHQVVVATHGRGIWTVDIPEIDKSPYILDFTYVSVYNLNINTNLKVAYDSVQVFVDGERQQSLINPVTGSTDIPIVVDNDGTHVAYMKGYISGTSFKSNTIDVKFTYTPTGLASLKSANSLLIYPNPGDGEFKVKFETFGNDVYLNVYSLNGLLVYFNKLEGKKEMEIDLKNLQTGTYILKIQTDKIIETRKIIIK